jgi:hypothetical protein
LKDHHHTKKKKITNTLNEEKMNHNMITPVNDYIEVSEMGDALLIQVVDVPSPKGMLQKDKWQLQYRIMDSNGGITNAAIQYNVDQNSMYPYFVFFADPDVSYTIACTFAFAANVGVTYVLMFEPVDDDDSSRDEKDGSSSSSSDDDENAYFYRDENGQWHHVNLENDSFDEEGDNDFEDDPDDSANFPGDSLPKPGLTKEQLDDELQEYATERDEMLQNKQAADEWRDVWWQQQKQRLVSRERVFIAPKDKVIKQLDNILEEGDGMTAADRAIAKWELGSQW